MRYIFCTIKFFTSFVLVLSFINVCNMEVNNYGRTGALLAIIISFFILGVYAYYLIRTGIWNFRNNIYLISAPLLIGFLTHFAACIFMIYYVIAFHKAFLFTVIPVIVIFALSISVYDFMKFLQASRNKKLSSN